ncbi:MAG: 3-deoxy-manno-octulosonate cytidylyltransferase [Flavobacteriaceae bacterium]|nr:3-deoxy-manno-octulosonate cytidylyltransferase [Flavobacteriaceae bacterium]
MNTIIIPARYASTRFPGKPLALIGGKSMVQRVFEQCLKVAGAQVAVATDDDRIASHVASFGGIAILTSSDLPTGTDRCAAVLASLPHIASLVINVQGDEPFINPAVLVGLFASLQNDSIEIATLYQRILSQEELTDPNVVKVVKAENGNALYFSRSPLPYLQKEEAADVRQYNYFRHLGVYAFRADVLEKITKLKPSSLEQAERLEQLRWLENGYPISLLETKNHGPAVDTPEDLLKAERYLKNHPE